ncbi:uncharacterized protein TNCV_3310021 [Trichonephila clavipes]|nr:uncharacterized protein TNCV_3310021 [Trichonephila clavipes]
MIGTRLFCEEDESISNSSHSEEESIEILKEKPLTLDEKLEKAIYSKAKVLYSSTKKSTSFNKIMKQEMQLFDSTENPSPNIIKLCDALKTIPPTSVEAERAFSAAGLFVTKLRTRLSDKRLLSIYAAFGSPTPEEPQRSARSPPQPARGRDTVTNSSHNPVLTAIFSVWLASFPHLDYSTTFKIVQLAVRVFDNIIMALLVVSSVNCNSSNEKR